MWCERIVTPRRPSQPRRSKQTAMTFLSDCSDAASATLLRARRRVRCRIVHGGGQSPLDDGDQAPVRGGRLPHFGLFVRGWPCLRAGIGSEPASKQSAGIPLPRLCPLSCTKTVRKQTVFRLRLPPVRRDLKTPREAPLLAAAAQVTLQAAKLIFLRDRVMVHPSDLW